MSPQIADQQLPTDGIPIIQPKDTPSDIFSSPVIPDRDISHIEQTSKNENSATSSHQMEGVYMFGTAIKIDGPNKRIIISDGTNDRIILGFYDI